MKTTKTLSKVKAPNKTVKTTDINTLTNDQAKAAAKAKREANPQFANVQSKKRKFNEYAIAMSIESTLMAVKNISVAFTDVEKDYENALYQAECKKFVNWLLNKKNEKVLSEFARVYFVGKKDKKSKNGLFSLYRVEQMVQKIVRLNDKGLKYVQAIQAIEVNKLSK